MPIPTHTITAEASIDFQKFAIDGVKNKDPKIVAMTRSIASNRMSCDLNG